MTFSSEKQLPNFLGEKEASDRDRGKEGQHHFVAASAAAAVVFGIPLSPKIRAGDLQTSIIPTNDAGYHIARCSHICWSVCVVAASLKTFLRSSTFTLNTFEISVQYLPPAANSIKIRIPAILQLKHSGIQILKTFFWNFDSPNSPTEEFPHQMSNSIKSVFLNPSAEELQ